MPISLGNGCGSVLHSIAVKVWIISAKPRVESTYRCWSSAFSTGRTATISVTTPTTAHAAIAAIKPGMIGRPTRWTNSAPNTPPSMPSWPAVKLMTREAANMML